MSLARLEKEINSLDAGRLEINIVPVYREIKAFLDRDRGVFGKEQELL